MTFPFFRSAATRELDELVAPNAVLGIDGAIVVSPSRTIELAAGEMTGHAAHIARLNAHRATELFSDENFRCDSGHYVHLRAIGGDWVLAVQTAHIDTLRLVLLKAMMDRAVARLRLWVSAIPLPLPGPGGTGSSGAPAEVTWAVPRKRLN